MKVGREDAGGLEGHFVFLLFGSKILDLGCDQIFSSILCLISSTLSF